jgi:hypothetical protein
MVQNGTLSGEGWWMRSMEVYGVVGAQKKLGSLWNEPVEKH